MRRWLEDHILKTWLSKGLLSTLLLPLAWLYGYISRTRIRNQAANAWHAPVPVIVIGNIIIGGTGKTPVTMAICKALLQAGWTPGIISRGYGIPIKDKPRTSDTDTSSSYLGDEPSLLHQITGLPVAVHPKRPQAAAALLASHKEIDVLISDDGLQHMALARDIEVIVQDDRKIGNGRLIPAGPLREPAERIVRADFIINNCTARITVNRNLPQVPDTSPEKVTNMRLKPGHIKHLQSGQTTEWDLWLKQNRTRKFNAVAGIGQPARFFNMLTSYGIELEHCLPLADHKKITAAHLGRLDGNPILITAKDAIKCTQPYDARLNAVYADTVFDNDEWLNKIIEKLEKLDKK